MTVDKGVIPQGNQGARHLVNLTIRELEKMARLVGVDPKGHGISAELLFEPGVRRHNSDDELEELLLPDSSPDFSSKRRRRSKAKDFKDSDSNSSSSEDFGYADEESLDDEEEFSQTEQHKNNGLQEQTVENVIRARKIADGAENEVS